MNRTETTTRKWIGAAWWCGLWPALIGANFVAAADAPTTAPAGDVAAPATQPTAPLNPLVTEGLDAQGVLRLPANKSAVLRTRVPLKRVNVAGPEVADVTLVGPTEILVTGKKAGATQLILWNDGDRSQIIDVNVTIDYRILHDQIAKAFPDAAVEVNGANGAILLRGRVPSLQVAEQVVAVASNYGASVINMLEVSGGQQVVLQVRFAEVARSVTTNLGFNAFATDGKFRAGWVNGTGGSPPGAFATGATASIDSTVNVFAAGSVGKTAFEFFVDSLRQNNLLRVLAEPNLTTMSGHQASFLAGGEFPIPVPQAGGGGTAITVEYKQFGVRLDFTPVVMGDGRIRLDVSPEVSDLDFTKSVSFNGFVIPSITKRNLHTTVELGEGQTFALGGLLNNRMTASKSVTPLLGDLPVLGPLFRSVRYSREETELVVLVTPHLAGGMNPNQVPKLPGEFWRYPNEWELYVNKDLGGPADDHRNGPSTRPGEFRGRHGFAPADSDKSQ